MTAFFAFVILMAMLLPACREWLRVDQPAPPASVPPIWAWATVGLAGLGLLLWQPVLGTANAWVLDLLRDPLGWSRSTTLFEYETLGRAWLVAARPDLLALAPSSTHLAGSVSVVIGLVGISLMLPSEDARLSRLLRAVALVQGASIATFWLAPSLLAYEIGDLIHASLLIAAVVVAMLPAYLIVGSGAHPAQALGITLVTALLIPVRVGATAILLSAGGQLYLPLGFLIAGPAVDILLARWMNRVVAVWYQKNRRAGNPDAPLTLPGRSRVALTTEVGT